MDKLVLREEINSDHRSISEVTKAAFKEMEISNHTEHFIIDALRAAKSLSVSLVAELDSKVVGHIAFSPVTMSDGTMDWYGLGPVSVLPEHQGKGIGKALILEGLKRIKILNAKGCCLVGHPEYYRKFGFKNNELLIHEGVPMEFFFVLPFDHDIPKGAVNFHDAFKANGENVA